MSGAGGEVQDTGLSLGIALHDPSRCCEPEFSCLCHHTRPGTVPNQFHHRSRRQRDDGLSDPVKTGIIRVLAVRQQTFAGEVGTMHRDDQLCQD